MRVYKIVCPSATDECFMIEASNKKTAIAEAQRRLKNIFGTIPASKFSWIY